ncbi:hypothetical protein DICVIV_11648 [Dictyocaulus viviparus]|uniref:Saposin B-type domain-containing protein n=1 Tax=Dictyocaulus viviparus TaxID=29172 RepID=A0A0D8XJ77_DICVI|nr:hypothetical protein DICVIV_11648 [Dictyocaulus viviparus]
MFNSAPILLILFISVFPAQQEPKPQCGYCIFFIEKIQEELKGIPINETSIRKAAQQVCETYGPERLKGFCEYLGEAVGHLLEELLVKEPQGFKPRKGCEYLGMCPSSDTDYYPLQ